MTIDQANGHYLSHQNLIHKAAWQRIRQNPSLDFQDLVSCGNVAYCEALGTWDPAKGKFSTHLVWRLRHRLGQENGSKIEWDNNTTVMDEAYEVPDHSNPLESGSLREALEGLGTEAMEVVNLILGTAGEFCDFTAGSIKATRTSIQQHLRSWGWKWNKINAVMDEIKSMLRNM